jgi:hypothetical protein
MMGVAPKDLAERIAVLETTVDLGFRHIGERLDKLAEDLSDQGKTPPSADRSGGRIVLPITWTPVEIAKALALFVPVLVGIWGVSYSGAQYGGSSGASTAVEEAVELGEAVPVAAPAPVQVVPVPLPIPVPVVDPEPVVHDDLMPPP